MLSPSAPPRPPLLPPSMPPPDDTPCLCLFLDRVPADIKGDVVAEIKTLAWEELGRAEANSPGRRFVLLVASEDAGAQIREACGSSGDSYALMLDIPEGAWYSMDGSLRQLVDGFCAGSLPQRSFVK